MADNSADVAKMARILAFFQIITGVLLLGFGIADRLVYYERSYYEVEWTGYGYFGVWIGVWMLITGGLGIPGSGRERTTCRNAFAGVFMGFSITSAVFGGIIIICYSIGIDQIGLNYGDYDYYDNSPDYHAKLAVLAIMLILGIVTFGIGIWAAICTCLLKPCCGQQQVDQQMYPYPAGGYVATQLPGSVPVTVPMQAGGDMGSAQGFYQPMVLVPVSGAPGDQHLTVQFQPRLVNTDSSLQGADEVPPSHRRGGYAPLRNDQTQVMV